MSIRNLIFIFLSMGGLLFLGLGISEKYRIYKIEKKGEIAIGKVIEVVSHADSDKNWTSYKIAYNDIASNGHVISTRFNYSYSNRYKKGDGVCVVYDVTNPDDAFIDTYMERNYSLVFSFIASFVCFSVGGYLLVHFKAN